MVSLVLLVSGAWGAARASEAAPAASATAAAPSVAPPGPRPLPTIPHGGRVVLVKVDGTIDLGLAPLDDGPVARCKCGLKALQYMATGVPVVASPVGALREIVVPGETGLHATSTDEWERSIASLLEDPAFRRRLGRAGRAVVETRWSYDAHAAEYESALRG